MSFTFERSLDPSYYIVQLLPLTSCILECKFKAIGRRGFAITTTYDKGEGSRLDGLVSISPFVAIVSMKQ